jgi:nucleoside-diphosphate-sugar epimerase
MKTVLITGVNGFIGSHLAEDLAKRGHRVVGSTSHEAGLRVATPGVEHKVVLPLGGPWDPGIVRGVEAVIHSAWDVHAGAVRDNIAGTRRLVEAAEAAGAAHQVFISTYSAHRAAVSDYGKSKLEVQEYVLARGHAAVRPGLVIGPGGMFQRLADTLARHRVIPLVDGGRGKAPIIAIADFLQALAVIVERRLTGLFNLYNPDVVTLKDVMLEIRTAARRHSLLVPVPSGLLLGPVWLLGRLRVHLPITVDNLRGLRANVNVQERSDLPTFVPRPLSLAEMVRAASSGAPASR